jgi:hypothetical protein
MIDFFITVFEAKNTAKKDLGSVVLYQWGTPTGL